MIDPIRMTWPLYRRGECRFFGRSVRLSWGEAEVLSVLLLQRGRPVFTDHLIEAIYPDPDREPECAAKCVHVFISRLRHKLPGLIGHRGTICGRGFRGWTLDLPQRMRLAA